MTCFEKRKLSKREAKRLRKKALGDARRERKKAKAAR
jgi:hypothetical protein